MANLPAALDRVRQVGDEQNGDSTDFERYESDYEAILTAVDDYGDKLLFEETVEWLVETTREDEQLPTPEETREQARRLSMGQGIIVPANSPLRD